MRLERLKRGLCTGTISARSISRPSRLSVDKERSTGITVSAVMAFAGSALCIALVGLNVMTAVTMRVQRPLPPVPDQPVAPGKPEVMLGIMAVFYLGFAIWGIVSGVGLLRLRNWARLCFAVFGSILSFGSLLESSAWSSRHGCCHNCRRCRRMCRRD